MKDSTAVFRTEKRRQIFWGSLAVLSFCIMLAAAGMARQAGTGKPVSGILAGSVQEENTEDFEMPGDTEGSGAASGNSVSDEQMPAKPEGDAGGEDIKNEAVQGGEIEDEVPANNAAGENSEPEETPMIAFTFDDGPYTPVTNRIIDVLSEYGAGATFFVVGSRIEQYSDTLKRTYESGFEVASHTWSHDDLNKLSEDKIRVEFERTEEKLNQYVPVGHVLARPPYGNANETVRSVADTALINWSLDSQDWKTRDTQSIIDHVLATVKDGDVILMHDLYECTAEAVEYLVPELMARGYRIVSVSELFASRGRELEKGKIYRSVLE